MLNIWYILIKYFIQYCKVNKYIYICDMIIE